jgi:dTDP-4-dehydrorhamnose reductase
VPHVLPISTADYPTPARRPAWSVLDNAGFEREVGIRLPDWRDGLRKVIEQLAH